ncbi:hypothetical protein GCK72_025897 [Caenorhabditis remanei]|uniref:Uncharacterized protein n=1 Tax=Caenorhabditis remanei TaxID=31234 RepID=A0A6A5G4L5_CAERE|nr:hypothetical protein GCK72_025897 [Caenorhabditis remanei]KAF1749429.1 hypothetical protein GCK72_025897 [Caenorhabditis remanei]
MSAPIRSPHSSPSSSPRDLRALDSDTDPMEFGESDNSIHHNVTPELGHRENLVTPELPIGDVAAAQVTPSTRPMFSMAGYHSDSNDGAGPSGLPSIYLRRISSRRGRGRFRVVRQPSSSSDSASTGNVESSPKSDEKSSKLSARTSLPLDLEMDIDNLESMTVSTSRPPVTRKRPSDAGGIFDLKVKHSKNDGESSVPSHHASLSIAGVEITGQSGQAPSASGEPSVSATEAGRSQITSSGRIFARRRAIVRRREASQEDSNDMETDTADKGPSDSHCDDHGDKLSNK